MANIFDYLDWRSDLPLAEVPLCDADALLFSRLAYIPFDGIASSDGSQSVCLCDAAAQFLASPESAARVLMPEDAELLRRAAACPRFSSVRLARYHTHFDADETEQFAACTFLLGTGAQFLAFRGTDNTLVGWKEDFNMSFMSPVSSQIDAVRYLAETACESQGSLYLGGHSKGGNLAVYAAAFCPEEIRPRIACVFNNDGPGFPSDILATAGYAAVSVRIRTFVPQSSVVGMFLEHEESYTIIHSTQICLLQHEIYSWEIMRGSFVCLDTVTNTSRFLDHTFREWISGMTPAQREILVNTLFDAVGSTDAVTLAELGAAWNRSARSILRTLRTLDPETQRIFSEDLHILWRSIRKNVPFLLPRRNQDPPDTPQR